MTPRYHYFLSIADLAHARGSEPTLSYDGAGPNDFAAALQEAMRSPSLFERWRLMQPEPDEVDKALGVTDANAQASAKVDDLRIEVDLITNLPMSVVRPRLNWLIGSAWQLRDMRSA